MIRRLSRPTRITLLVLAALYALYLAWELTPFEIWVQDLITWMQGLGTAAYIIYAGLYLLATLLVIPLTPLNVGAGFAFGFATALPLSLIAATIGAVAAFLLSRCVARRHFTAMINRSARLSAVEASVTEKGWRIVMLLRISPIIPSHILNYLCGVTGIGFAGYVLATFIGKIPLIALFSYIGAVTAGTADQGETVTVLHILVSGLGLLATVLACWLVARDARRRLRRHGLDHD